MKDTIVFSFKIKLIYIDKSLKKYNFRGTNFYLQLDKKIGSYMQTGIVYTA